MKSATTVPAIAQRLTTLRMAANRLELPTWAVAMAVYTSWAALVLWHDILPFAVLVAAGGFVTCWHGSLQHETIHGHPTGIVSLNRALAWAPLSLWVPYDRYSDSHLRHHDADLTDPWLDPESYYEAPERWQQMSGAAKALRWSLNSLAGRLLIGPLWVSLRFWRDEARVILGGDRRLLGIWIQHGAAVVVLLYAIAITAGMPAWKYILAFAYPGLALTLLRSFAEHRYDPAENARTAIVHAGPLMSLMFLNNNLHIQHHDCPGVAWFRLPSMVRARTEPYGGPVYRGGYAELASRFLFRPIQPPCFPAGSPRGSDGGGRFPDET